MAAFAFAILDIIASSLSSMQHRVSVECLCPVVVITLKGGTVPEAVGADAGLPGWVSESLCGVFNCREGLSFYASTAWMLWMYISWFPVYQTTLHIAWNRNFTALWLAHYWHSFHFQMFSSFWVSEHVLFTLSSVQFSLPVGSFLSDNQSFSLNCLQLVIYLP